MREICPLAGLVWLSRLLLDNPWLKATNAACGWWQSPRVASNHLHHCFTFFVTNCSAYVEEPHIHTGALKCRNCFSVKAFLCLRICITIILLSFIHHMILLLPVVFMDCVYLVLPLVTQNSVVLFCCDRALFLFYF